MDIILVPLFAIIQMVLGLAVWALIIYVLLGWLVTFNIINTQNQFIAMIIRFLQGLLEPILDRIRQKLPNFGGLDLSPLILILAIYFLQMVIGRIAIHLM